MQLNDLKPTTSKPTRKRIGRGGKRGKTSGRGHKGQKARAGNSTRSEVLDFIKKLPKLRGHGINRSRTVNSSKSRQVVLNVSLLNRLDFEDITPKTLLASGFVSSKGKKMPVVKILGNGELSKKVKITNCLVSKTAKEKIEAAGGVVNQ